MNLSLVGRTPLSLDTIKGVSNLTDREAMGLPQFYEPSKIDIKSTDWYAKLFELDACELSKIAENPNIVFSKRYAAGNILNLKGDPRINTFSPKMIDIPAWEGKLGLRTEDVKPIVEEYKSLGILSSWIEKETPQYAVKINAFRIAKYPLTNMEFMEFLADTKYSEIPSSWKFGQFPHLLSNHPVYTISDQAAIDFCEWLSQKTGKSYRLPTEAEWEFAASGRELLEFPWGNTFKKDHANTVETGILQSTPVGIFPKGDSPFGCTDMSGNVEEYIEDYYGNYGNELPIVDDLVEINGRYRVARGGSFTRFRDLTRCKRRHGANPKEIYVMGFRYVEDLSKYNLI